MRLDLEEKVVSETKKLNEADFIREDKYADWIPIDIPYGKEKWVDSSLHKL